MMNAKMGIVCVSMVAAVAATRTARACGTGGSGCYSQLSTDATALRGDTSSGYGVFATASTGVGVYAVTSGGGEGVIGTATNGGVGGYFSGDSTGLAIETSGSTWLGGNIYVDGIYYTYGSQTTLTHYSDARLKKNIKPLVGSLEQLLRLRGVTYEWKEPSEHGNEPGPQRGFVAQEVEGVFPDWVSTDAKGIKMLNTRGLEPLLVESLRTLQTENDGLRAQSAKLEERVKALESRRAVSTASFGGSWGFLGLALVAGALVLTRRREQA